MPIYALLTFGLLAAGGNLLGGFLVTRATADNLARLRSFIAIGAGFMLAAVCLEIIPTALEQAAPNQRRAMALMLAGYLTLFAVSCFFAPHSHSVGDHRAHKLITRTTALQIVCALVIHTFFDGVTIATGLLVSRRLGLLLLVATVLHKIPEGLTVASVLMSAGRSRSAALSASMLIAAATFIGVLSILLLHPSVLYTLPLSAGVTFYVVASDLIPEISREGKFSSLLLVSAGVGFFYLTHLLLRAGGLE
jgi:zinc and cadmium transporter